MTRKRPQSGRLKATAAFAAAALIGASLTMVPAQASTTDALDLTFSGTLTTSQYTTQEPEAMRGNLVALTGNETQVPGEGLRLAGGGQGAKFMPSGFTLGSGAVGDTSFVAEVAFTPTAEGNMQTLLSAGGNFSVRFQNGKLRYGWDSQTNGSWANHRQEIDLPSLNERHVVSMHYRYVSATSAVLDVMLDGVKQPSVESDAPIALHSDVKNVFGLGNEVHPGATDPRGFVGTLHHVRIQPVAADQTGASIYELQPRPATDQKLFLDFTGTASGTAYTLGVGETAAGTVTTRANPTIANSTATFNAADQVVFFTPEPNWNTSQDHTKGFVVEAEFTPKGTQRSLGTIIAVGGNFFIRYQGDGLRYGWSGFDGTWQNFNSAGPAPAADTKHVVSVAYEPLSDGTYKMTVWLDGRELTSVTGTLPSHGNNPGVVAIGGEANTSVQDRAFNGSVDKVRFALLNGAFKPEAFEFQTLLPPVECDTTTEITPGNYVPVSGDDCKENIIRKAGAVRPTAQQQAWQEYGLTGFVHFGINTFYNQEWGHGNENVARFNPTSGLDIESWVKHQRDAGFKMAILTLKHHDGFLLYPSRYNHDFSVANTPWKNGEGDVVREFTDAAHKYGMKVGLYMSPADSYQERIGVFGNGSAKTPRQIPTPVANDDRDLANMPKFTYDATDYGAYFLNTLYEVLTEYGQVDEVWFDGAGGNTANTEVYDYPAFFDMIYKLQPNTMTAVGGLDIRWIGNESGVARNNEWSVMPIRHRADGGRIDLVNMSSNYFDQNLGSDAQLTNAVQNGGAGHLHWWPAEADMKLTGGWFAHNGQVAKDTPKSASTLMTNWMQTVGRNSVMLLNVPPTVDGTYTDAMVNSIDGFAAQRRMKFGNDVARGVPVQIDGKLVTEVTDDNSRSGYFVEKTPTPSSFLIELPRATTISTVSVSEDTMHHGQQINAFKVEAEVNGAWTQIAQSGSVGVERLLDVTPVSAKKFRLTVTEARNSYAIANWSLYQQLTTDPGLLSNVYVDCSVATAGDGSMAKPFNSLEQLRRVDLAPGAHIHFKAGVDCAASDVTVWAYGAGDNKVRVDVYGGEQPATVGGQSLSERFAGYERQGWDLSAVTPTEPSTSPTPSASASTEPSVSASPSTSAEPSTSASPSASVEPSVSVSAEPSTSAEPSPSAEPSSTTSQSTEPSQPSMTHTATSSQTGQPSTTASPAMASVSLDKNTVRAGDSLIVTGKGYAANESVKVEMQSDPILLTTVVASADGAFTVTVKVPSVSLGSHSVVATGLSTGRSAKAPVTVVTNLPNTGAPSTLPALFGALLLLAGVGLVVRRRRLG